MNSEIYLPDEDWKKENFIEALPRFIKGMATNFEGKENEKYLEKSYWNGE